MNMERKVVVVTGASGGLGEAIVDGYRSRNYRVVATSRSIAPTSHPDCLAIRADIADPETGGRVIESALERFGRVDTLINNAGIFIPGPFERSRRPNHHDPGRIRLLERLSGSSVDDQRWPCRCDGGLAIEYASRGIWVNAVAPGMIKTPLLAPETYEAMASLHPLKRMGEPDEIARAILYLEDANFVTGETIHVDGGQIAGH